MQRYVEVNKGKQNKLMTGQIISLLDLQAISRKAPIFTWVADDWEISETTQRENLPLLDIIDAYPDTQNNTSIYTKKGFLKVHDVHKTESPRIYKGRNVCNKLDW